MKETINVNIAQQAFTMDVDAYSALMAYLDDISCRLPESDTETLSDIESRVAEIFRERVPSPMMVITYGVVRDTMSQIGSPENFGAPGRPKQERVEESRTRGAIYRSRTDRSIAGVCGGIAERLDIDSTLVRVLFIVGFFAGFSTLILYLILWLVLKEEPVQCSKR